MTTIACYPSVVGFDITRAISESFGSRSPLLDRVLSYLYFADVTVIEQSTCDDYGSGVSILGFKGNNPGPGGMVLGCPLPTVGRLERDPATLTASGGHPLDLARFVDLMAKIWALSELEGASLPWPVSLVAYRPDPVSLSFLSLIGDGLVTGDKALVFSPTGHEPRPAKSGFALLSLSLSTRAGRRPGRPVMDVASVRIGAPLNQAPGNGFVVQALRHLLGMTRDGLVELLDLAPVAGSDLASPGHLDVDLGLMAREVNLPDGWVVRDPSRSSVRLGVWSVVLPAVVTVVDGLAATVNDTWTARDAPPPATPVRILSMDGSTDDAELLLAVPLPPGDAAETEALLKALNPQGPVGETQVCGRLVSLSSPVEGRSTDDGVDSSASLSGVAPWLTASIPGCREMGPVPGETQSDPEGTGLVLARAYLASILGYVGGD